MDARTAYVSQIPESAVAQQEAANESGYYRIAYLVDGELIGHRWFDAAGRLEWEVPYRNGVRQGWDYRWHDNGVLMSAEPFAEGLAHGTAYQWSEAGMLIGSYTLDRGTGWDIWFNETSDGTVELAEAAYFQDGAFHPVRWWFEQSKLWREETFYHGESHGVERRWNERGQVARGYPRYWIHNEKVTKREYVRACKTDPTLTPFDAADNDPKRDFPPEVARYLPQP